MKIQKLFEGFEQFRLGEDSLEQLMTQLQAGLLQVEFTGIRKYSYIDRARKHSYFLFGHCGLKTLLSKASAKSVISGDSWTTHLTLLSDHYIFK